MNNTIRRIAVSGSAAVALLGGAAAITAASAPTASAVEIQAHIDRATGAPVNMPDGRIVHVRGMDAAAYTATPEHTSTIVLAAAKTSGTDPAGISNGLTADGGQGSAITSPQNPATGVQTGYNQQVTTQAGGGAISITVAMGVGLLIVVVVMVRKGHVKFVQAAACVALGVYLAPTFFGPLVQQLGGSVGSSLGNVWSGL
jgi:hypothetical protein